MPPHAPSRFLDRTSPPHIGTLIALTGISALAMNLFLPSLPGMAAFFDTSPAVIGLSIGVYLFVNATLQMVIGPISDKYGRRRVILAGLLIYLVATLGCIFSTDVVVFLSFRMMQASVAVAMVLSRAVVRDTTPADQAGSKIAYVTMGMAVVPMVGPAIGGYLEQRYGWQANFWLLFAMGVLILILAWVDLGETAKPSGHTLAQQYREVPELLKSPRFWGYSMATLCAAGSFFAFLGGAPFVASNVYELEPQELGLYFAAPASGYFVGNFIAGRYSARLGINRMLLAGLVVTLTGAGGSLAFELTGLQSINSFFLFIVPMGIGNGMSIPNGVSGALSVRPQLAGTASGLNGAMMLGGGAALSAASGFALRDGTSGLPLVLIMNATTLVGIAAVILVIRREARLGGLA